MVQGGAIGEVTEAWANVGGPSGPCYLPPIEVPEDVDWDLWLGPAPWRPFHPSLITGGFRPFRDYSGGGMTDWGCHTFGGALFALGLHETGPVEIIPPDGTDHPQLTYVFANGVKIYHGGGWDGILNFRGTEGEISEKGDRAGNKPEPPDIYIPELQRSRWHFWRLPALCADSRTSVSRYRARSAYGHGVAPGQYRLLAESPLEMGSGARTDPRRSRSQPLAGSSEAIALEHVVGSPRSDLSSQE